MEKRNEPVKRELTDGDILFLFVICGSVSSLLLLVYCGAGTIQRSEIDIVSIITANMLENYKISSVPSNVPGL